MYVTLINTENFEQEVLKSTIPVVVYFYSDGCRICEAFKLGIEGIARKYYESIKFVKISRVENKKLVELYNIKKSPSVLFFENGKQIKNRRTVYSEAKDLLSDIKRLFKDRSPWHKTFLGLLSSKTMAIFKMRENSPSSIAVFIFALSCLRVKANLCGWAYSAGN